MTYEVATVAGSYLSPSVRKVLVCLAMKGIAYEIDPHAASSAPATRGTGAEPGTPVFRDRHVSLAGGALICEYLEERYPEPALFPATPQGRARVRWLQEYADTRMGEVFVRRLFNEHVLKPQVAGEVADPAIVKHAVDVQAPQVLDYLEREFSAARPYLYGTLGIAEITVASLMRNAAYAGYAIDAVRWPALHNLVNAAWQNPAFAALEVYERLCLQTPVPAQRAALLAAGAPVTCVVHELDAAHPGALAV